MNTAKVMIALLAAQDALTRALPYIEVHKKDLSLKSFNKVMITDQAIGAALTEVENCLTEIMKEEPSET